mgnify:CR=1 FL=1
MPLLRRRTLLAGLPALAAGAGMGTAVRADPMQLKLGTGLPGGGVELYGIALVDGIHSVDPTFDIATVTTKGIQDNVAQLEAGTLDLAVVFGEIAHELFAGIGRPPTKLRIMGVVYATPGMFAVRADSQIGRAHV